MKKGFSILFALMILLSGMHLTLATHLCGGELSAVKVSFTHQKAGCGMCEAEQANTTTQSLSNESCCKDEMSFYAVDNNYSPSTFQVNEPAQQLAQVFYIPANVGLHFISSNFSTYTNVHPPDNYFVSDVNLPDICVFRI
ncbi:MAG: hypothetical protein WCG93_11090 [Paludibacter sp.]